MTRRLAEHAAGRGARLLAVVRDAGIGWQLARLWPGSRARERQIKRQGGHARQCPLCGVRPRALPRNRDGSLSRTRTTDAQKLTAGVMTAAQLAEHTALRRGAVTGKPDRPAERGPLADDPWAVYPAPGFDRATAERDQLRAARDAVRLVLPGRSRSARRARAGVLRELNAGRLPAATAVMASGLLTRPGVPELHRAALAASLGADLATLTPPPLDKSTDTGPDIRRPRSRAPRRTSTAVAVARLRTRHPDLSAADIAARLGISDRTVRRHLSTLPAPAPAAAA